MYDLWGFTSFQRNVYVYEEGSGAEGKPSGIQFFSSGNFGLQYFQE